MIMIDMLDLMADYSGEFIFAGHLIEQAFSDIYGAAGEREGIHHGVVGNQMKRVGKMAMGMRRQGASDSRNVCIERRLFGSQNPAVNRISFREFLADSNFF